MNSDIYGISETGIFGTERLNFLEWYLSGSQPIDTNILKLFGLVLTRK